MAIISVSLPTDGSLADVADHNTPITTIVNAINGNLDNTNLAANAAIAGSKIADGAITPGKLDLDPAAADVATSQTTTSVTYTDLATVTDTVTVVIGANGLALVNVSANMQNNAINNFAYVSFTASGANTIVASDGNGASFGLVGVANSPFTLSKTKILTGLTAGSTVFKMKYKVSAGTGTFADRHISVIPL